MAQPDTGDIVIRQERGDPAGIYYLLGTPATPECVIAHTLQEAVSQALTIAKRHGVRAWLTTGNDFVLLGALGGNTGRARMPKTKSNALRRKGEIA